MNVGAWLANIVVAVAEATAQGRATRLRRRVGMHLLTGLLVVLAVAFVGAAITVWLASEVGTIWSLVILAAFLVILAGAIQGMARKASPQRRPSRRTWL
jgi:hypothetical protein